MAFNSASIVFGSRAENSFTSKVPNSVVDEVNAIEFTGVVVLGLNWKVKCHPVTSSVVARVQIDNERTGPVSRRRSTRSWESPLNSSLPLPPPPPPPPPPLPLKYIVL